MTLLDFGLAEELPPAVRFHFISFLHTISAGAPAPWGPLNEAPREPAGRDRRLHAMKDV